MEGRRYRSKLELLRDFLSAAQEETRKTRIMNRANLNPASFSHYLSYCTDNELVMPHNGGYTATPRGEELLRAIDAVISKATDLRIAVEVMDRTARSGGYRISSSELLMQSLQRPNGHDLPSTELPFFGWKSRPERRG